MKLFYNQVALTGAKLVDNFPKIKQGEKKKIYSLTQEKYIFFFAFLKPFFEN